MPYTKIVGIYLITCIPSGCVYVGGSVNIKHRWEEHRRMLRNGKHGNPILQASYNKYGPDAFEFSILNECGDEILDEEEKARIVALKLDRGENFVMNIGGDVRNPMKGRTHSPATRQHMSESRRGRKRPPRSVEWCRAISEGRRGKSPTEEHRRNAAAARIGLTRSQEAKDKTAAKHRGMKRSAATKALWSRQRRGRIISPEQRVKISETMKRVRAERFWSSRPMRIVDEYA